MTLQKIEDSQLMVSPQEFDRSVEWAHQKASKLKEIVDSQKLSIKIGQSEHLKVEGWQTIGKGYGYTCRTAVDELIKDSEGTVIGVKASASILDGMGAIVGGADSFCFQNEGTEDGGEGKSKQNVAQLAGMAQTRAESRGFKQILSWVVILAGYNPTPAEEMTGSLARPLETNAMMLCPEHNIEWFRGGKMKSYAHIVEGQQGPKGGKVWCNMTSDKGDGVLDKIDQLAKAEVMRLGWGNEQLVAAIQAWFNKDWRQLTPTQKQEAVGMMAEQGTEVDPATGEII